MLRKQMLTGAKLLFLLGIMLFVLSVNASAGDLILARDYYLFGAHCNYGRNWGSRSGTHLGLFRIDPIVSTDPPLRSHGTYNRWTSNGIDSTRSGQPTQQSRWRH
jgi:hypothetical protein